jgi:hypothetical protein
MSKKNNFNVDKVLERLTHAEYWARKAIMALVIFAFVMFALNPSAIAYGDDGGPPTDEAASNLVGIFTDLGKLAIKVIYALVMIVFAVGTVKSGLGAQAAQAFGATGRVSLEMMNLVGGIVIFGIAIMTLPLANMIIDTVTDKLFMGGFSVEINNPFAP